MPSNPLILCCALLFLPSIFSNIRVFSNELALLIRFSSVAQSCPTVGNLPVHHQLLELTQTQIHRVGDAIQPSHPVVRFSSCPQSYPALGSFQMNQLFASGGYSIGASASVLPMNIQGWFPLGLTGLISLLSKGLSRVFFNTTVQKYKFFGA